MTIQACDLDFSIPIRHGIGEGVTEDGKVDACLVQRAWLRAWCRENPGADYHDLIAESIPDEEPTISRVIRSFAIALNDGLPDGPRQRLVPYEDRILGTATTDEDEERRAWLCTDWIVRTFAPTWLRKAGLTAEADDLVALPELHSDELAEAASPIIIRAKDAAAWAARDAWAAWAARAARDARAAWAARAARDAGSDSVLAIAYEAAKGKPSYTEALAAAEAALAETTAEIEDSLFALLDSMIAVGQAVAA